VPWCIFTRFLKKPAAPAKKKDGTGTSRNDEILRLLQLEYPWLSEAELRDMLKMHGRTSPQTVAVVGGGGQQQELVDELPADVIAQVSLNLEALRAEVAASNAGGVDSYFKLRVLGGIWSVKLQCRLTTDFGCYAMDKSVSKWCSKTKFPERKSFAVNLYGFSNARVLAEEVVRLGDHFMSGWVDEGSPVPFDFGPLRASYQSTAEYQQWFDDLPLDSASSRAAFELMVLMPMPLTDDIDVPWRRGR
jgi:hypothetical protein